jgi:hypothetical protein
MKTQVRADENNWRRRSGAAPQAFWRRKKGKKCVVVATATLRKRIP